MAKLNGEISKKNSEHGKTETKKAEAFGQIERDKNEEVLETTQTRQAGREKLLGDKSKLEGRIENIGYLETEQKLIDDASAEIEQSDAEHQSAVDRQTETDEAERKARIDHDAALTKHSQAKTRLEERTRARDKLVESLNPEPGTWLAELRSQDPDWGSRLGRIIDPDLLQRKDLNPKLAEDLASSDLVMGWSLELDAIDIPAFADSESRIRERIDRANQAITVAFDQLGEAEQALKKRITFIPNVGITTMTPKFRFVRKISYSQQNVASLKN